jgi:hypothetical protein
MFCAFLGSSTLFSRLVVGLTELGVVAFGFGVLTTNSVSIISSFNLQNTQFNQPIHTGEERI